MQEKDSTINSLKLQLEKALQDLTKSQEEKGLLEKKLLEQKNSTSSVKIY